MTVADRVLKLQHQRGGIMRSTEGMRIQRVHKFPKWMEQGCGVAGGGEMLTFPRWVNDVEQDVYCSHSGINGTVATPGYFCVTGEATIPDPYHEGILRVDKFDMTQEWWRIHKDDY